MLYSVFCVRELLEPPGYIVNWFQNMTFVLIGCSGGECSFYLSTFRTLTWHNNPFADPKMIEWILVANDTLERWELKYSVNLKRFLYSVCPLFRGLSCWHQMKQISLLVKWNMWTFLSGSWWISWPCWCCPMRIFLRFCVLGITISLEVKWSRFGNKTFSWPLVQRGNFSTTKWT